jgi:DinB family protein
MTADQTTAELESLRNRLAPLAVDQPGALTEPDPDTPEERWGASEVWAHIAEFVGYWHEQMAGVVNAYRGEPVPFGRLKTDASRRNAIETGAHRQITDLAAEADREIVALENYLKSLDEAAWHARGLHPARGAMDVGQMYGFFITKHLAEHAAQLEGLAKPG